MNIVQLHLIEKNVTWYGLNDVVYEALKNLVNLGLCEVIFLLLGLYVKLIIIFVSVEYSCIVNLKCQRYKLVEF